MGDDGQKRKLPPQSAEELLKRYAAGERDFSAFVDAEGTRQKANLEGADLAGAHLEGANLAGADLDGANLIDANLAHANLKHARLAGANLERAHLEDAHLEGALLAGANLKHARLAGANLERAYLLRAHLEGASLLRAHLEGADLADANLEGANLAGANLEGANLEGANLEGANLERAVHAGLGYNERYTYWLSFKLLLGASVASVGAFIFALAVREVGAQSLVGAGLIAGAALFVGAVAQMATTVRNHYKKKDQKLLVAKNEEREDKRRAEALAREAREAARKDAIHATEFEIIKAAGSPEGYAGPTNAIEREACSGLVPEVITPTSDGRFVLTNPRPLSAPTELTAGQEAVGLLTSGEAEPELEPRVEPGEA